ncbi:protein-glutamate O-methyltransferase CheR [Alteromonas sp. ASW11-36]|uniref:protein-glutamate O-methyltransferase n=1 Tax=Alteromonas arenosi TaxID=3055817 RepID=A0ABT7SVJ8_9ALTE|nr:protein-glutamate O-methyltransferase CheR [Alteromonas sp. ASW11-36]
MSTREVSAPNYQRFCQFLERETGILLGDSKQYLVRSRLLGLLHDYADLSLDGLIDKAIQGHDRKLQQRVLDSMTTNETLWFRDTYPFTLLTEQILPAMTPSNRKLRIWSAACSTGQEAYSIAMTILDFQAKNPSALKSGFEVVGSDISEHVLQVANKGEYDKIAILRGLPASYQSKYFNKLGEDSLVVKPHLKQHVSFKKLNLLSPYTGMGTFDIVFCRNVLIYFSADNKKRILQQIAACLSNDGSLLLGASESVTTVADLFQMVKASKGLYYKKKI